MQKKNSVDRDTVSRTSMIVLTGDENDLLSESPLFEKAQPKEQPVSGF